MRLSPNYHGLLGLRLTQSTLDPVGREWHLTQSDTSSVEDSVAQCGSHRNGCQFACAGRLDVALIKQHGLDVGHVREPQHRIRLPIQARDVRSVELHGLEEAATDPLKHGPLNLMPEPARIDDSAASGRDDDLRNTNAAAGSIDLDGCHDRCAVLRAVLSEGDSAPAQDPLAT